MKINQISPSENKFTQQLVNLYKAPKTLFYRGELPSAKIKSVAIVGARKPTNYGKEVAEKIAAELARAGVVIVSGMALGIDGIAHNAALDANGKTIAVLANGVDYFYPRTHESLGQKIINSGGTVLSEYPNGTPALPHQFLERNRIVSGLADAVIVVEAALRSGTLSTANHALEQGKDVFAVPGNITSKLSEGCNNLIKCGAHPLTCAQDIFDILYPNDKLDKQAKILLGTNNEETLILELISKDIFSSADLLQKSKLSVSDFNQAITMLEINGQIKSSGTNSWRLN